MIETHRRSRKGFSLVELLIAFFVLLVGILAVLVLFPLGLRQSNQMVEASTASFVGRNARALMEAHPFEYSNGGDSREGHGTASIVQIKFGPRGTRNNITVGSFPVMFPRDVLGDANDDATTFPAFRKELRVLDPGTGTYDRIIYEPNPQFTWDARFTIGRGPAARPNGSFQPPPGNFTSDDVVFWWVQYYRYYAVQIAVYRNYAIYGPYSGTIYVRPEKKSDGSDYDADDPNRPLRSEFEFATTPDSDLGPGSHIRIRDHRSDWYEITETRYEGGKHIFRLDRPYAGLDIGTDIVASASVSDVIGTNSLVETFTTLLGSQLDDINTSNVSYP